MVKTYSYEEAIAACTDYFNGNEISAKVCVDKYLMCNEKDELVESNPRQMHRRLAKEFARIQKQKYEGTKTEPLTEAEIFDLLDEFRRIIPQGSPMSAIGNPYQIMSLSNCVVIDSPRDSYSSIMRADEEIANLSKRRCGIGLDISYLRPEGISVKNAAKTATGIVPWMARYSNTLREVGQGGRRAAGMITIDIRHPESVIPWTDEDGEPYDIEVPSFDGKTQKISSRYYNPKKPDFASAKVDSTKVTGANISLKLNSEFMQAVVDGTEFKQQWPIDSDEPKIVKYIDARAAFDKIMYLNWFSAEPGILMWDKILSESPPDCYKEEGYETQSTNPCFPASESLLDSDGYKKFGDLYEKQCLNTVVTDNRVEYHDQGNGEKPENWKISNIENYGHTVRHASHVFKTQENAEIIELITKSGLRLKCTPDHHIATTSGMVEAQHLTKDHDILIGLPKPDDSILSCHPASALERLALLAGLITGDGTFKREGYPVLAFWGPDRFRMRDMCLKILDELYKEYGDFKELRSDTKTYVVTSYEDEKKITIGSRWLGNLLSKLDFNRDTKHQVPKFVLENSRRKIGKYYLAGLVYTDGSVQGTKEKGYSIRISQSNKKLLRDVQKILQSNGLLFKLYKRRSKGKAILPNGKGGSSEYNTKAQYDLISHSGSINNFYDSVGVLGCPIKEAKLQEIKLFHKFYKTSTLDKLKEIKNCGREDVYCIQEPVTRSIIVNGIVTRRCGEVPLSAYSSCRLLSLNLFGYVKRPYESDAEFDWKLFYEDAYKAQKLMDDIVDLEQEAIQKIIDKVDSDPEPESEKVRERYLWQQMHDECGRGRRTGLGLTALGSALAALNIKYSSDEGIEFAENFYKTLKFAAYKSSIDMAKEIGPFPIFDADKEKGNDFIRRIEAESLDFDGVKCNGEQLCKDMQKYGRRNIAVLTQAPTGSISMLAKLKNRHNTTSGIEPEFTYLPYKRRKKVNHTDKSAKIDYVDQNGDAWQEFDIYPPSVQEWLDHHLGKKIEESPFYQNSAQDIDWPNKVKLQGAVQRHIDHSISNTTNVPNDATVEDIKKIYMEGWLSGCKGITVYRDGCRSGVLVTGASQGSAFKYNTAPKRPEEITCDVHQISRGGQPYFVLVGLLDDKYPYEVFAGKNNKAIGRKVKTGKIIKQATRYKAVFSDGAELAPIHAFLDSEEEAITRLISTCLRHGTKIDFVVKQLEKTEGTIASFSKCLAKALSKYIENNDILEEKCPECGDKLIRIEGCKSCNCGYSACI